MQGTPHFRSHTPKKNLLAPILAFGAFASRNVMSHVLCTAEFSKHPNVLDR